MIHLKPRLVVVRGNELREQLLGTKPLSHELCAVIMRRMGQIDAENSRDGEGMRWRKFMEPDFSVSSVLK